MCQKYHTRAKHRARADTAGAVQHAETVGPGVVGDENDVSFPHQRSTPRPPRCTASAPGRDNRGDTGPGLDGVRHRGGCPSEAPPAGGRAALSASRLEKHLSEGDEIEVEMSTSRLLQAFTSSGSGLVDYPGNDNQVRPAGSGARWRAGSSPAGCSRGTSSGSAACAGRPGGQEPHHVGTGEALDVVVLGDHVAVVVGQPDAAGNRPVNLDDRRSFAQRHALVSVRALDRARLTRRVVTCQNLPRCGAFGAM